MALQNRPILTDSFDQLDQFVPEPSSTYVFGVSGEERSAHSTAWEKRAVGVNFVRIEHVSDSSFQWEQGGGIASAMLRSSKQLHSFWQQTAKAIIYLDITGLDHTVWAPLLRAAIERSLMVRVVYVEPSKYRFSPNPREGDIFDLSERIQGVAPLPGFASLANEHEEDVCFIPLLGFEGVRLKYVIEQMNPPGGVIFPIIGIPGFRPEYPFFAYDGNRPVLDETRSWMQVRYARANCPFSMFYVLDDIAKQHPTACLKIAMIGTKPHALGAIMFALSGSRRVELIYDNPIRKANRTEGSAATHVYHVGAFSFSSLIA